MSNGAGNSGSQPVSFRLIDAERISKVVNEVESGRRGRRASTLPRAAGGGGGGGSQFVDATYSGAWPKGQIKDVNVVVGSLFTAATTLSVYNGMNGIMPGGVRKCFVVRLASNTATWVLVNAEA